MMGVKEAVEIAALAIGCQRVLGQVVGANREEIYQLCQTIRHHHSGWRLNHNAQLDVLVKRLFFLAQLCLDALTNALDFQYFPL